MSANPDDKQSFGSPGDSGRPLATFPGGGLVIPANGGLPYPQNRTAQGAGAWGPKMPLPAIPPAEEGIQAVKDIKDAQRGAEGSWMGLGYDQWRHVGVYALLAGSVFLGVWGLLGASPVKVIMGK